MRNNELLFCDGDLGAALESRKRRTWADIDNWNPDEFLATAAADVTAYLVATRSVQCPVLDRDRAELLPVAEEVREGIGVFSGEFIAQRVTKIVLAVPFDGEADVFRLRASTSSTSPPRAVVQSGELRLTWRGDAHASHDSAAVRAELTAELDKTDRFLSWARHDIANHNAELQTHVPTRVAQRRGKLLADRQLQAAPGLPVRQRPDAAAFAVPVTRRTIETPARPRPGRTGRYEPEPVLAGPQYEQAVAVLRNARNALERSPTLTATLGEEKIRDLLLVFLNAQFEGAAADEVFNAAGRTDILIRAGDRNVFIAECKIWAGPAKFRAAIGQLLSYLTWRDTKAAQLLFIRTGRPSEIIAKAIAEIENHPSCKRTVATGKGGGRHDFILRRA